MSLIINDAHATCQDCEGEEGLLRGTLQLEVANWAFVTTNADVSGELFNLCRGHHSTKRRFFDGVPQHLRLRYMLLLES